MAFNEHVEMERARALLESGAITQERYETLRTDSFLKSWRATPHSGGVLAPWQRKALDRAGEAYGPGEISHEEYSARVRAWSNNADYKPGVSFTNRLDNAVVPRRVKKNAARAEKERVQRITDLQEARKVTKGAKRYYKLLKPMMPAGEASGVWGTNFSNYLHELPGLSDTNARFTGQGMRRLYFTHPLFKKSLNKNKGGFSYQDFYSDISTLTPEGQKDLLFMSDTDGSLRYSEYMSDSTPEQAAAQRMRVRENLSDDYEYSRRRFTMLDDIFGNSAFSDEGKTYEAYQLADEVIPANKMLIANGVKHDKHGYYRIVDGIRQDYQMTYDRHARPVYALMRSNSLTSNLAVNAIPANEDFGRHLKIEHLKLNQLDNPMFGDIKDRMVLTGAGAEAAANAKEQASKLKFHFAVIDQLLDSVKQARAINNAEFVTLSNAVVEQFGLQGPEITPQKLFSTFHGYLARSELSDVRLRAGDVSQDPLRGIESAIYKVFGERGGHPAFKESSQWSSVASDMRTEHIELSRLFPFEQVEQGARQADILDNLHITKEANESSLDYIAGAMRRMERSDPSALQAIKNAVSASAIKPVAANAEEGLGQSFHQTLLDKVNGNKRDWNEKYGGELPDAREAHEMNKLIEAENIRRIENGHPPLPLKSIPQPGLDMSTELGFSDYNKLLSETNAYRTEKGLEAIDKLDYFHIGRNDVSQDRVNEWRAYQAKMDEAGSFMRRPGDLVPVRLTGVDDTGMVSAQSLTINPKNFDIRVEMDKALNVIDQVKAASADHGMRDNLNQLTKDDLARIGQSRSLFVYGQRLNPAIAAAAKEFSIAQDPMGFVEQIMKSNGKDLEELTGFAKEDSARASAEGYTPKRYAKHRINTGILDVIANRAGWMFRSGTSNDELASHINDALTWSSLEHQSVTLNPEPNKLFNQEFEDTFIKHLHRNFFDNGVSSADVHSGPVDNLVRSVAEYAEQYIPFENDGKHLERVINETGHLLGPGTGAHDLINGQYKYYSAAADPEVIRNVLTSEGYGHPAKATSMERLYYLKDIDGDPADNLTQEIERRQQVINKGVVNEWSINKFNQKMDTIKAERDRMLSGDIYKDNAEGQFHNFNNMRQQLGDDYVDRALSTRSKGGTMNMDDMELFKQTFHELKRKHGDTAYTIMDELFNYRDPKTGMSSFNAGVFSGLGGSFSANGGQAHSISSIENVMKLVDQIEGLKLRARIGHEEYELTFGRNQEILARSLSSGITANVGTTPETITFSGLNMRPTISNEVVMGAPRDGTLIDNPHGTLPIGSNSPYNTNKVTRSGSGYMSSSDVGTRQAVLDFKSGHRAVGYDFETTGLADDAALSRRGLVLPTEMYAQQASWENGAMQHGNSRHVTFNLGAHQVDGVSVKEMISAKGTIGGVTATQLLDEHTGEQRFRMSASGRWEGLSEAERATVMSDYRIGFMRNVAKYSPNIGEDFDRFTSFGHTPGNIAEFLPQLQRHARAGLRNLAGGLGGTAEVAQSLKGFMGTYNDIVDGNIHILQNGADADLVWANQWSKQVGGGEIKPQLIEQMHLSRILDPEERSHSLKAQVNRSGIPGLRADYEAGSHLADVDTKAMLRLTESGIQRLDDEAINPNFIRPGQHVAKVVGRDEISHGLYTVGSQDLDEMRHGDGYRLRLVNQQGEDEFLHGRTLQEVQRKFANGYKAFDTSEQAHSFLNDLTFDDAREDVNAASTRYQTMVRERNAAMGVNTGHLSDEHAALTARAHAIFDPNGPQVADIPSMFTDREQAILGSGHIFDGREPRELSARQQAAAGMSGDYFRSRDAEHRLKFLGDIEDLKNAGAIDQTTNTSRELINSFNENIKARAMALGHQPQFHTVPGLTDLGKLGDNWGPVSGMRMTAMANTYAQAENSLWGIVENMRPLVQGNQHGESWKAAGLGHLMRGLKETGILSDYDPENPRMANAVDAVMAHLSKNGPATVENNLVPFINGSNQAAMEQAYQDARDEVLRPYEQKVASNPVSRDKYIRNQALREELLASNELANGLNLNVGSRIDGSNVKLTGSMAGSTAHEVMGLINGATDSEGRRAGWGQMLRIATDGFAENGDVLNASSDANVARGYLGWQRFDSGMGEWIQNPSNQFVHPIGDNAGRTYGDLEDGTVKGMLKSSRENGRHNALTSRISQYLNDKNAGAFDVPIGEMDPVAQQALRRQLASEYVSPDDFIGVGGAAQPRGGLMSAVDAGNEQARSLLSRMWEVTKNNKGKAAIGGAIVAAGMMVRQWTRGDQFEARPGHDSSPDSSGTHASLKQSSPAYNGPTPSNKTYLTDQGYNVSVSGRNPGNVNQDSIGGAMQDAMGERRANVNIHHQDDTTTINSEWLRNEFGKLL